MHRRFLAPIVAGTLFAVLAPAPARAADEYVVDPAHSSVYFRLSHLGLSYVYGRFNDVSGTFSIDATNPGSCSFVLAIKPESIDTNNQKRDEHLRSPDFFNVKQFPVLSFKSTSVKAVPNGYEVTGDMTMHGATRPLTFTLEGGKQAELPKGVHRTGFSTELKIKRSEFGMDKFVDAIGDEVHVAISFEGTKK